MDQVLEKFNNYPELLNVTKGSIKNIICYGKIIDQQFIDSLVFVYTHFFNLNSLVLVPELYPNGIECNLYNIENLEYSSKNVIIFNYTDLIIENMLKTNKKRFFTQLKNISKKCKIIIFSLSHLELSIPFEYYHFKTENITLENLLDRSSLINLIDPVLEKYNNNIESFIEFIESNKDKSIYIFSIKKLVQIEFILKLKGIPVSKDESTDIVIGNCPQFLKKSYSIYIYILPFMEEPLELIKYTKDLFLQNNEVDIYFDESTIKNINEMVKKLCNNVSPKIIKDSIEFDKYSDIPELPDSVMATENYYLFKLPDTFSTLNLKHLNKKEQDSIRNYIKVKLIAKFDLDVKTCQLSYPSSPKDRSRKLNSLSNKISSFDYRCDVTCEVFQDFTIGVIIWSDFFANRSKKLNVLKNQTFIYQTTTGKWKYTTIT
jgi:hypothetical protein